MMEWYYILGIISYGIFLVQFLASLAGWDSDLDVDFDGDVDFGMSDLVSFKGLVHFCMGLSGWLILSPKMSFGNITIGVVIGIVFVFVLFYLYVLCMKLQSSPSQKIGIELLGEIATVYSTIDHYTCVCTITNGGVTQEIKCLATTPVKIGENREIIGYLGGYYYI